MACESMYQVGDSTYLTEPGTDEPSLRPLMFELDQGYDTAMSLEQIKETSGSVCWATSRIPGGLQRRRLWHFARY